MARATLGLALLCFAAGVMDAIAFLALGQIFTSAMSGNTILFGIALGQGHLLAASHSLAAFAGYVAGVAGGALPLRAPNRGIERALGIEVLFLATFAALWLASGPPQRATVYLLIACSAVAMGLQGAVGRAIRVPGIPTVVFTSTLTAIVATLAERALGRERSALPAPTRQQMATFAVYLGSAVVAGLAVPHWLAAVAALPLAAVSLLVVGLRLDFLRL